MDSYKKDLIEIRKVHKEFRSKMNKLINQRTHFFAWSKISPEVNKEFRNNFQQKHYGRNFGGEVKAEVDGVFEAWNFSSLMQQAMQIGFEMGQNPKLYDQYYKSVKILLQIEKSFSFNLKRDGRRYNGLEIVAPLTPEKISNRESDDASLKKQDFELVKKSYFSWLKRTKKDLNKIKKQLKKI